MHGIIQLYRNFHFIYTALQVVAGIKSPLEKGEQGGCKNSGKTQPPESPFIKGDLVVLIHLFSEIMALYIASVVLEGLIPKYIEKVFSRR